MSRVSTAFRSFAAHLIAQDAKSKNASRSGPAASFPVIERLRAPLTNLMGGAGFSALISRSLALATADIPALRGVQLKADGVWEGLEAIEAQLGVDGFLEARVVVLAQLLGLLVAFVGEALTLRLMAEIWPNLPPTLSPDLSSNRQDIRKRDRNEKTK
jgi:hypothetical protein